MNFHLVQKAGRLLGPAEVLVGISKRKRALRPCYGDKAVASLFLHFAAGVAPLNGLEGWELVLRQTHRVNVPEFHPFRRMDGQAAHGTGWDRGGFFRQVEFLQKGVQCQILAFVFAQRAGL